MPKFHKVYLIITIFIIVILLSPFIYLEVNKNIYENRVTNYLLEERGYNAEEIASVEGVFGFKMPKFYTTVTFEDEPYVKYTYFAHNEVLQFNYEIIDEEHEGITKEDLKNYDPSG
ncbi:MULTISPECIES: DUF3139 domain-containing protein [Pontibacillus]|uniref:DUF3139 domain-containing protein n=1 Tax=Pontibacillus marinus BH030004 = DSM 16465 TaxID=1385511 RepID=A0A0A5HHI9_9BACI|nr:MULTISPECIES: DUF3139 domain-containing protein [Pontibacillus]KGX83107.1 hypothetical protein N783_06865 [Pontibacillus marinus BH030004 = DSM 16465]QHE52841.1 DUF3139 domain-containing protein [Pontibacillus sp. HMF3514]